MKIILSLVFGAIVAVTGYLAGRRKRKPTKPPAPGVTTQGDGGPGEEQK